MDQKPRIKNLMNIFGTQDTKIESNREQSSNAICTGQLETIRQQFAIPSVSYIVVSLQSLFRFDIIDEIRSYG